MCGVRGQEETSAALSAILLVACAHISPKDAPRGDRCLFSLLCCLLQVEEGLALLLEVLQNPALQKAAKVWYMLRAQVLQLTALYLSLPPSRLSPELRQRISTQGEPLEPCISVAVP